MAVRFCILWILIISGCGEQSLDYTEVKRIDEPVSTEELKSILDIARNLPEERLPKLPAIYTDPPTWPAERTLSVKELVAEELETIRRHSDIEQIAEAIGYNPRLDALLRKERMTREQFVGLFVTIGVAMSRSAIVDEPNYEDLIRKGRAALRSLKDDQTSFATYSEDQQYFITQQAKWLTRIDRAEKLIQVPPENVQLVQEHSDLLTPIFPIELQSDPLRAVINPSEEMGTPFEDIPNSNFDQRIEWSQDKAILGSDRPLTRE
ncbi:hypothetical protein [Thalassoroseus pseudoceratinae]|uniref:hypothetical protein n=1 Tax=Thalassoroseus pseudoceratinae TaxID=2713176 RepID=UPI0014221E53|nr:hypothetical protein [Thalassoroseus pseudoceratinae]